MSLRINCERIVLKLLCQTDVWSFPEIEITFFNQAPQQRNISPRKGLESHLCLAAIMAYLKLSGQRLKRDPANEPQVKAFSTASKAIDDKNDGRRTWARKAFADIGIIDVSDAAPLSRANSRIEIPYRHPISSILDLYGWHTAQWADHFDAKILCFHVNGRMATDGQLRSFIKSRLNVEVPSRFEEDSPLEDSGTLTSQIRGELGYEALVWLALGEDDCTGTALRAGDQAFVECLSRHRERIRTIGGATKLDMVGDRFLLRFPDVAKAVDGAVNIHRSLTELPIPFDGKPVAVRTGIHVGNTVPRGIPEDVTGTILNVAACYQTLAGPSQILISEEAHVLLKDRGYDLRGITYHDWGLWFLKGVGERRVFEVLWGGKCPVKPFGYPHKQAPRFSMPFVGRSADVSEVMALLQGTHGRLVTVKGEPGIGKTRLADEVSNRLGQFFAAGVHWVDLETTANSEPAVESEIRVQCGLNRSATLEDFFLNKHALVVLDNFESVVAASGLVRRLRNGCGALHLLVTSRVRLHLDGEQLHDLDPMDPPDARDVFLEYARLKDARFELTADNADQIAEIVKRTDRIPVCLELVAAQVRPGRTLEAIIRTIKKQLLSLEASEMPSARHRSIAACLEASFDLLSADQQKLFPQLTVFSGGFLPEDVTAICRSARTEQLLDLLHGSSLLRLSDDRYFMLPTVAEYASRKMGGEGEELRRRHANHYLCALQETARRIRGPLHSEGSARLREIFENCRSGIGWAAERHEDQMVVDYAHAFSGNLFNLGRADEELDFCKMGLESARRTGSGQSVASAQNDLGNAYWYLHTGNRGANLKQAIACYEDALVVYAERDFPAEWAMTQNNLGRAYRNLSTGDRAANVERAIACFEAAERVYTKRDYPAEWARTQNNLGKAYRNWPKGDRTANVKQAVACFEAALTVRTKRDFPVRWAATYHNLGETYINRPDGDRSANVRQAISCFEAALSVRTERDFPVDWAMTQNGLGAAYNALPTGDRGANVKRAIVLIEAALRVFIEQDFPVMWAAAQHSLGEAYLNRRDGDRGANVKQAIACFEAALRVRTEQDSPASWAATQDKLGIAYSALPTADRGARLCQAAASYESAIRGYRSVGLNREADEVASRFAALGREPEL